MKRRTFLASSVMGAVAGILPLQAQALQLSRPVRVLAGMPPGGTVDLFARTLSEAFYEILGERAIVENRTGAGGFIAAEALSRAVPDGHTLGVAWMGMMSIAPVMPGQKLPIDVEKDLTPISTGVLSYNLLASNPDAPFRSVPELIDYAKKHPGELTYASSGNGTSQHLAGELFKRLAGVDIVHVPYRGAAPAVLDIIAGHTDMVFGNQSDVLAHVRSGGLRPIAFGSPIASPLFPELPLISEWLPEFVINNWFGIVGPAKLPNDWVAFWNSAVRQALGKQKVIDILTESGVALKPSSPEEMRTMIAADRARWQEVITGSGIKAN